MSTIQVSAPRLAALGDKAAGVASAVAAIAPAADGPGEELGSAALAAATGAVLDSWLVATWEEAERWGEVGAFLTTTADGWVALDARLAGLLGGGR